jgi:hypothetical protein
MLSFTTAVGLLTLDVLRPANIEALFLLVVLVSALKGGRRPGVFAAHYNGHRPHRALSLKPPYPTRSTVAPATGEGEIRIERRDRLGGLVHEYVCAA